MLFHDHNSLFLDDAAAAVATGPTSGRRKSTWRWRGNRSAAMRDSLTPDSSDSDAAYHSSDTEAGGNSPSRRSKRGSHSTHTSPSAGAAANALMTRSGHTLLGALNHTIHSMAGSRHSVDRRAMARRALTERVVALTTTDQLSVQAMCPDDNLVGILLHLLASFESSSDLTGAVMELLTLHYSATSSLSRVCVHQCVSSPPLYCVTLSPALSHANAPTLSLPLPALGAA